MKCEHRYVLYDRVWWICSSCDAYYRENQAQTAVRCVREWAVKLAWWKRAIC